MINIKLEPHEIQLAINAIENSQIFGRDAHMVSATLKKFETKLASFKPVEKL